MSPDVAGRALPLGPSQDVAREGRAEEMVARPGMDPSNGVQNGKAFGQGRPSHHGVGYWGTNALNLAQVPPICT